MNIDLKDRCVVVSPRHEFIRPWIRAYFASGNTTPLVIVPGPPGDWRGDDMEYCMDAARYCGGVVFDCSEQWEASKRLSERAVLKNRIGWFTKKSILHAVATKLAPRSWAWIDDDAEVTGSLDECFSMAESSPGFICSQFYRPSAVDRQHPERMYRSNIDTGDKICWNSMIFFHGDANKYLSDELWKDFPVEDDECVFGHLYQNNKIWHDGFCDFSFMNWQKNCKRVSDIPAKWRGKLLHYTANRNGGEVKKIWASKADTLPPAPFEMKSDHLKMDLNSPIDAVFVIGPGSVGDELRYALRNLAKHCKFVRNVYICGICPSWVDKTKVIHLQWPDRFDHAKDANIVDKLRHACEHPGIAKNILFCSDDQFQTRPCSWEDFRPRYLRRFDMDDTWYDDMNRPWHRRLRKTLERDVERRRAAGLDESNVFYYQPHIWMPIDRDRFIDYARWCNYERRDDTIIASGYFNFIDADGFPDKDNPVVFLNSGNHGIPDALHIAYNDASYNAAMSILRNLFPESCIFELNRQTGHVPHEGSTAVSAPFISPSYNPSPATPSEADEIAIISSKIRDVPEFNVLLGELSRAEELRLFGVGGWRIVWSDIASRIESGNPGKRSAEAAAVVNSYLSNPEEARTVRFGIGNENRSGPMSVHGTGAPRKFEAPIEVRESLRNRIRSSLRSRF